MIRDRDTPAVPVEDPAGAARELFEWIDEAVSAITPARVQERLEQVLHRNGMTPGPVPGEEEEAR